MAIVKKARPRSTKVKREEEKFKLILQPVMLTKIVRYFFTTNPSKSRSTLVGIRELFSMIDEACYTDVGDNIANLFYLITFLLEEHLELGKNDEDLLEAIIDENLNHYELLELLPEDEDGNFDNELSDEEISQVDVWTSDRLNNAHILRNKERFKDFFTNIDTGGFKTWEDINNSWKELVQQANIDMNRALQIRSSNKSDFDLSLDSISNIYNTTINNLNRENSQILTGSKGMNDLLGGGYQPGRVYLHLGRTGGWKSGYLLHAHVWARTANKGILARDPTKKPCSLYITHENDMEETAERLYEIVTPPEEKIPLYERTVDDICDSFIEYGFISDDESNIDNDGLMEMKFIYRANKSWNTADVDAYIDELSSQGLEVMIIFHDYIKRIKAVDVQPDLRLELPAIADEFSTIAKRRKVPIVTAMQINREGIRILNEAAEANQVGLANRVGEHQVGESQVLLENVDWAGFNFVEHIEADNNGEAVSYLTCKRLKTRIKSKAEVEPWMAHPFETFKSMRIPSDLDLPEGEYLSTNDLSSFINMGSEELKSTVSKRNEAYGASNKGNNKKLKKIPPKLNDASKIITMKKGVMEEDLLNDD